MERGQATVEYSALTTLALVAACALVQFTTPVAGLASDLVHILVPRVDHAPRHHTSQTSHRRRPRTHQCLCGSPPPQPGASTRATPSTTSVSPTQARVASVTRLRSPTSVTSTSQRTSSPIRTGARNESS